MTEPFKNKLIDHFGLGTILSRKELYEYYLMSEPELKESTFAWRIYDLKKRGFITPLRKSTYVISEKATFKPMLSERALQLARFIFDRYDGVRTCMWDVSCLNEFTQHLISSDLVIIEIEKDSLDSVYYSLKDKDFRNVFIKPDSKTMEYYVSESDDPVILKELISRSPLKKSEQNKLKYFSPALEKILVDILADKKILYFLEGMEKENIIENAFNTYYLDRSALINYAARRGKKELILKYINKYSE